MIVNADGRVIVVKLAMVAIYTNFDTYIVDDTGIEQVDAFLAGPASDRLILSFKAVDDK